jgi:predicted DNA-binding protein with PD1-like motif
MRSSYRGGRHGHSWSSFVTGDEAASGLVEFARLHGIDAARLCGIGGFSRLTLGFFDCEKRCTSASTFPSRSR